MDAKDRIFWTGDEVRISHYLDVDQFGERNIAIWTITSAEEVMPGEVIEYELEDTTLYGSISVIQPDGAPDYTPGADLTLAYIGDAAGLLSDGTPSARIT